MAAKVEAVDRHYWEQQIEPLVRAHPNVEFIGEIGEADKAEFLGNAAALLFPIDWSEPFGLVMIEAMACGTPVIAWRSGSVPEVIDEARTGFMVRSIEEAIEAIAKVENLTGPSFVPPSKGALPRTAWRGTMWLSTRR